MRKTEDAGSFKPNAIVIAAGTLGMALALSVAALTGAPQRAEATPAYAQQTGKACGACHTSPGGGGALTSAGKAFQKSHK
jgi:mono/diheme cytochrome c family protein